MPSPTNRTNRAIIAAAGSRKTQYIIDEVLAASASSRVLITTYTTANCEQIVSRICEANGYRPPNVDVLGWFAFLMNQAARPYQSAITGKIDYAKALNFKGKHLVGVPRRWPLRYYFDGNADFYRDGVAEFAVHANQAADGRVIRRLEALYNGIYIDEFQDLAGYDLNFLELLFASKIEVTIVGDPRQQILTTNNHNKNSRYRGQAIRWLNEQLATCEIEYRTKSWRCNQEICDWADDLYPELPRTVSQNLERTGHDGVFPLLRHEVPAYVETYQPTILRWDKTKDTLGLPARNMKGTKGCTFNRVLIFPTGTMREYLKHRDPSALNSLSELYVAITRARYSVAIVVDSQNVAAGQQSLFDDTPYMLPKAS
jgi:DNA helicase II / ATP-dependent DNA helicase PcrA